MTLLEAAKQALDALIYADNELTAPMDDTTIIRNAIATIRQTIEQSEKQEPVATIGNWGRVEWADGVFPQLGDKMYSAPSQRPWVGLTDLELADAYGLSKNGNYTLFARAIETKLKEKNA